MSELSRTDVLRDSFSSQMPIAALFFAAIAGIVAVNLGSPAAVPAPPPLQGPAAPQAPDAPFQPRPATDCPDCGRVIAVDHPTPYHRAAAATALRESVVQVQLVDGSVRRLRQLAPDVRVGDRVRIDAGGLRATL